MADIEAFTANHVEQNIGLAFDNQLISSPRVMTPITGGTFMITGWADNLEMCRKMFAGCRPFKEPSWFDKFMESVRRLIGIVK